MTFGLGHKVLVLPFRKAGVIRRMTRDPSGRVLYGVVYDDEERRVKGRRGAMDVFADADHLQSLNSVITIDGGEACVSSDKAPDTTATPICAARYVGYIEEDKS